MAIGGLNLAAYPIVYGILGGDAHNGFRQALVTEDGVTRTVYYVRGHHIDDLHGYATPVSKAAWLT